MRNHTVKFCRLIVVVFLFLSVTSGLLGADLKTAWVLTDLYPDLDAWKTSKAAIPESVAKLEKYKGKLGEGSQQLREALTLYYETNKEAARLFTYANLVSDLDIRKPEPLGMKQELGQMFSELSARTAWLEPEILALSTDQIRDYLTSDQGLKLYARYLEKLEQQRPHVLDARGEEIMSLSGLIRGDGNTIGSILTNAEIPWKKIVLSDGTDLRVDTNGYSIGRAVSNREDRIKTYEAFYSTLAEFQQSLATTLAATAKGHLFSTRVRHYDNTLEASLSGSEVEPGVYNTLIEEVNKALPTLHRYLKLRARMLKIDDLRYHDLYPSLVGSVEEEFPWKKTVDVVLEAFAPMGKDYSKYLLEAVERGWVDVYPQEGKRSGAYMAGSAYDVHPYMLLNHRDDYDSASTFAHEAGHMMHSAYSNKSQPYPTSDYATFVAEVASTTQEWLFFKHTLKNAASDDEKLAILGNFLETFRTTVFRQTMFAEFERAMHALVEEGKPITSKMLNEIYLDLLRRYHGHDQGICTIDEKYQVEWAYIPHFHYNYYVYAYSTSFIAATAFQDQILTGKNGGVDRYIEKLLKAGDSVPPVEILRQAGVDMTTPEPFRASMKAMDAIMTEIEGILARRD